MSRAIAFLKDCRGPVGDVREIGFAELAGLLSAPKPGGKEGPGWMPADIEPGPRTAGRVKAISYLVLDVEANAEPVKGKSGEPLRDPHGDIIKKAVGPEPPGVDDMLAELALHGWRTFLHSSYSHATERPRYRLVFDLARPLKPGEIKPLGLHVAALLGIVDCVDTKCLEPARLFFLPRCPPERLGLFQYGQTDGEPLPVDDLLRSAWRVEAAAKAKPRRTGQSGSVIDAFNQAHEIGAILEQHGYAAKRGNRWLWPGSTSGLPGVRILPESGRVYSSHAGDPLNDGHAHDAFDVWRILEHGGDVQAAVREAARLLSLSGTAGAGGNGTGERAEPSDWPEPTPLPEGLSPVAAFDFALLPETLHPWAEDICERVQCAPDYVGATVMAALGAVIGRKLGIRPQSQTDWTETPNQWAILVGRPGVLKSPAMEQALGPLKRLAAQALEAHQAAMGDFKLAERLAKLKAEEGEKAARKSVGKASDAELLHLLDDGGELEEPTLRRYIVNNTTAASLGEVHRHNPNGLLVFRDELVGLLKTLDREDNAEAREFYLTGWNGNSPYTFDRIARGLNLHIPAVCLSLLGSTQPGKIAEYVRHAVKGGSGDDGLIQRFGLLVWPDNGGWRDVDRWPDSKAKQEAFRVFDYLDELDPASIGASQDTDYNGEPEGLPYLRFDTAGLELFREWRADLETRLRGGDLHPAMESHLAKYRKLVPTHALILHLAGGGTGPVTERATLQALAWAEYLETHAKRAYASVSMPEVSAAKAIIQRIRKGDLPRTFSSRDVWRPGWALLADREQVADALQLLVELDWLAVSKRETEGRTATVYEANPRGLQ